MEKETVKDRKYSVIGNILLKIMPKGETKYPLETYFKTTSQKEIIKDFIYYGSFIGFVFFIGFVALNVEHLVVPSIKDPNTQVTVTGNCPFILDLYRNLTAARKNQGYMIPKDYIYIPPSPTIKLEFSNTTCPTCDVCRECPTCQPIPDCVCTCPECNECPSCDEEILKRIEYWFKNECRIKDGSAGYQAGSADTCDMGGAYFEVDGYPKFKTRPSAAFYNPVKQVPKDCTINFMDVDCDGTFYLNNSIWMISGNGSMKWIHKK
jgi:hypothetical protein